MFCLESQRKYILIPKALKNVSQSKSMAWEFYTSNKQLLQNPVFYLQSWLQLNLSLSLSSIQFLTCHAAFLTWRCNSYSFFLPVFDQTQILSMLPNLETKMLYHLQAPSTLMDFLSCFLTGWCLSQMIYSFISPDSLLSFISEGMQSILRYAIPWLIVSLMRKSNLEFSENKILWLPVVAIATTFALYWLSFLNAA